ncbi:class I SAM-dependent methyltransferase [Saliterribacillus persicus]|uniref:Methyltransferase family protein n=1 Tax=Saliterribacillus persicus TaxID=930114 RepID=A0A368YDQ5_9BACI|nr:class I SAM-dependent methyltransferase [Saliterribacillus persicus]RCW77017.1 methyltransferase family protein [Saliterribacillus persicus]
MQMKLNTDNFLHSNPFLYELFHHEDNDSMAKFILTLLNHYKAGSKILDVGCGLGREVSFLNRNGYDVFGLDNSEEMLSWAQKRYPASTFVKGDQAAFSLAQSFDAIYCVGSTFLYNFSNETILQSLRCFREHLQTGGLLYLDMRNAAFFLTKEGQRWLSEELVDRRKMNEQLVTLQTRFEIDLPNQMLMRDYCWTVSGQEPVVEHLQHRLIFPQELVLFLEKSGFRIKELFDEPAPHVDHYEPEQRIIFNNNLQGRRMQVIAEAV